MARRNRTMSELRVVCAVTAEKQAAKQRVEDIANKVAASRRAEKLRFNAVWLQSSQDKRHIALASIGARVAFWVNDGFGSHYTSMGRIIVGVTGDEHKNPWFRLVQSDCCDISPETGLSMPAWVIYHPHLRSSHLPQMTDWKFNWMFDFHRLLREACAGLIEHQWQYGGPCATGFGRYWLDQPFEKEKALAQKSA